nr:MAG TPA: hypothetical protein [Caudoviricetes sp.]
MEEEKVIKQIKNLGTDYIKKILPPSYYYRNK